MKIYTEEELDQLIDIFKKEAMKNKEYKLGFPFIYKHYKLLKKKNTN